MIFKKLFVLSSCLFLSFCCSQCIDKLRKLEDGIKGFSFLHMNQEAIRHNEYANRNKNKGLSSSETSGKSHQNYKL